MKQLILRPIMAIAKWGVKKWALGKLNELIAAKAESVDKALGVTDKALEKADAVVGFIKSLQRKLADRTLSEDEADELAAEAKALVQEIVK